MPGLRLWDLSWKLRSHPGRCSMAHGWLPSLPCVCLETKFPVIQTMFVLLNISSFDLSPFSFKQQHYKQQEEEKHNSDTLLPDLPITTCKDATYTLCVKYNGRVYNPGPHFGALKTASSKSTFLVSLITVNSRPSRNCSYVLGLGGSSTLVGLKGPNSCLFISVSQITVKLET